MQDCAFEPDSSAEHWQSSQVQSESSGLSLHCFVLEHTEPPVVAKRQRLSLLPYCLHLPARLHDRLQSLPSGHLSGHDGWPVVGGDGAGFVVGAFDDVDGQPVEPGCSAQHVELQEPVVIWPPPVAQIANATALSLLVQVFCL